MNKGLALIGHNASKGSVVALAATVHAEREDLGPQAL